MVASKISEGKLFIHVEKMETEFYRLVTDCLDMASDQEVNINFHLIGIVEKLKSELVMGTIDFREKAV
tara:strand:+ start:9045 stop:9248 length:204 start_codon:yes stop_codon:yes gene_type:complete